MKHAEENDPSGPDVYSSINFIVFCVGEALRSHISETSCVQIFLSHEVDGPCDSKINYFDFLLLGVHQ